MHQVGEAFLGIPPEQTFPGKSVFIIASRVRALIVATGCANLLDYGSGKGLQYSERDVRLPDGSVHESLPDTGM